MRIAPAVLSAFAACFLVGCGIEQLTQGGSSGGAGSSSGSSSDAGSDAAADASLAGAGCGIESGSGVQLCLATSACPTLAVDTQALPHCGFRLKGTSSELVCACGESLCSMGTYSTCAQAANLLATQTEAQVCTQLAEGRCSTGTPTSSSSGGSSGSPTCDRACLQDCGGGAGCASICGC
jgi:hypothetical protein